MENSPTTNIIWYETSGGSMDKILGRNAEALSKVLNSTVEIGRKFIVVSTEKPVLVKARIELLIKEGKMKNGGLGIYPTFCHYDVRSTPARW